MINIQRSMFKDQVTRSKMQGPLVAFILFLLLISQKEIRATTTDLPNDSIAAGNISGDTISTRDSIRDSVRVELVPIDPRTAKETFRKKKLITAILAFPVPFGFVGMHRIYLGSEPWVPIVYLVTGGGGCGILPLIDFFYIITADEEEFKKYENNPKVFMFVD